MTLWKNLVVALVAAFMLAACSGSSNDTATAPAPDPEPAPDPAMVCADAGGEWNAGDMTCTSAEELELAALRSQIAALRAQLGLDADDDIGDSITELQNEVTRLEGLLQDSADAEAAAQAEAERKAMAALGKAMHAALGPNSGGTTPLTNIGAPTLSAAGLAVDAADGAGAIADGTDPASVTLEAGASAGSLDGWAGTNYAHTEGTGDSKVTNEAVVYINQGSPRTQLFVEKYGDNTEYTASTRTFNVGEAADGNIKAPAFPTAGTTTYSGAQELPGTYDGAPGQYECDGTCTATYNANGIQLSADWTFVHDAGASVSTPDAAYLFYGWWVSQDSDDMPTAASAFAGEVGDVDGTGDTASGETLTGSATYVGSAAGKFAMSNALDGTGSAGHFTADAELTANFGTIGADNQNGVTGTIDNFRLNDGSEDPGWSVELNRSSAWAADGGITGPASDATVWSINGNEADASGAWSGTMYDEMPGTAPTGDGSNIPTTVTGTFYSEFSNIGRMVGAFGADKE